jgi:hypothetical protein
MSDRHRVYQFIVTVEGREGDDFDVIKFGVTSQEACTANARRASATRSGRCLMLSRRRRILLLFAGSVKPPDDPRPTKTKEAAKRERTEEEIDADLALLQGAANTLDPKSRARSTNVVMRRKIRG